MSKCECTITLGEGGGMRLGNFQLNNFCFFSLSSRFVFMGGRKEGRVGEEKGEEEEQCRRIMWYRRRQISLSFNGIVICW